jgi:hypothetical protein
MVTVFDLLSVSLDGAGITERAFKGAESLCNGLGAGRRGPFSHWVLIYSRGTRLTRACTH